jgi:hypothetical protein
MVNAHTFTRAKVVRPERLPISRVVAEVIRLVRRLAGARATVADLRSADGMGPSVA